MVLCGDGCWCCDVMETSDSAFPSLSAGIELFCHHYTHRTLYIILIVIVLLISIVLIALYMLIVLYI